MRPSRAKYRFESSRLALKFNIVMLLALFAVALCHAQDIPIGVTYVCNGEHIYIEGCNIRDTSDTSTCMVAHPDHLTPTGLNTYTSVTRGALKKLLPTCTQPSAKELAAAKAFQKKQQDLYNANAQKAEDQLRAATQPPPAYGQPQKPKTPEERAITRCVTSGRLPASCTGNSLLGAFSQMVSQVLPSAAKEPAPGPDMAGVFEGPGKWRLDFIDGGVLVNCSFLSPDQHNYTLEFKNNRTAIVIDTTPKPLVLTLKADGTIVGPGPLQIDGVVATGTASSGPDPNASSGYTDKYGMSLSNQQAASTSELYSGGQRYYGSANSGGATYSTFSHRTATCPALNLSSKGAGVGVQTMQTDLLKTMFGGDKGPPTPPGIRMHGIFAASTGFSVQFFPESVILGCGPDAARAYPYSVVGDGTNLATHINAPDHPLTLAFKPDGSLDPGASGPYQVHGRTVTGQNDDGDFTFAPMEQTCNLAVLTPSKTIPSGGGSAAATASAGNRATGTDNLGGSLSTPQAPLGNAVLSIVSGFPTPSGAPNPLAARPYVLLRDSYGNALAKGGVSVPPGMSPYKYVATICTSRTPDCQKVLDAVKASAASAVRADAKGSGIFPGVPPGTYYLTITTRYNNHALAWSQAVQLKSGQNSMTLDPSNATPID